MLVVENLTGWALAELRFFDDDVALDVRYLFEEYLANHLGVWWATARVVGSLNASVRDEDDGPVVWLALAAIQLERGVLGFWVKRRALKVIDSGQDLSRWVEDLGLYAQRKVVLQNLRKDLTSSKSRSRVVAKPFRSTNPWPAGTVVAFRLTDGRLCLFRVVGEYAHETGTDPVVEILDWRRGDVPGIAELGGLKALGQDLIAIGATSDEETPWSRLQVVGRLELVEREGEPSTFTLWRFLDGMLSDEFGHQPS